MPKSLSAQAIISAIQSALQLSHNIRRAYANSLKSRSVLLPLPSFENKPNPFTINRFFDLEGARFVEEIEALKYLHRKNQVEVLSKEEADEYQEYYRSLFFIVVEGESNPQIKEAGLHTDDLLSLLKIRQWEKNAQFASTTLQLVAGTIVEIGIDYFKQFPKSIQSETVMGQALSRLLVALDTIPFSEEEDFKKAISQKIIPRLFITAVETIQHLPEEWVRDEKLRQLIEAVSRSINEDLYERISPDMSTDEMDEAIQWGQLVLSSLIRNARQYVSSSPGRVFDLQQGQEQLFSSTGLIIMELLYAEDELNLDLKKLFTSNTLNVLVKNAFAIFSDYPELLAKDDRLRGLVQEVSLAIAGASLPLSHLLPEILHLILAKTALHLPTIWNQSEERPRHLLIITLNIFLRALSRSFNDGKRQLSSQQLMELLGYLMEEVIRQPALLNKIGIAEKDAEGQILLEEIVSLAFEYVFQKGKKECSPLEKTERLKLILRVLLERVLKKFPDENGKELAILLLSPEEGLGWAHRPDLLQEVALLLLAFLENQAIQLSKDAALRGILSDLFQLLRTHWPEQEEHFIDLIHLILEALARQTEYLLGVQEDNIEYLVVSAAKHLLEELSPDHMKDHFVPTLNEGQRMHLFRFLLEEVLKRPAWITARIGRNRLLSELIRISFETLQKMPAAQRASLHTLRDLIDINMRAIATDVRMLDTIQWSHDEEEKRILEKLIELVLDFVFEQSASLQKATQALDLLDFMLQKILQRHPNHLGLRIAAFLLEEDARLQLSKGINETMVDRYLDTILDILTTQPDIIAPNPNIRQIITGVAQALQESGLDRPGLLPRVLQLVLIQAADTIELDVQDGHMKTVLLEALRQILQALSFAPEKGQWKPVFNGDHILEIVLYLLGEISENPDWIGEEPKVFQTLHLIFESLEKIPRHHHPSFSLIKLMIIKLFEAVRSHPEYFNVISSVDEEEKMVLAVTLEYLFEAIYEQPNTNVTLDILHQPSVMDALLDYYLYRTSLHPIEENDIRKAADQVAEAVKNLNEGHLNGAEGFLNRLRDELG
jgi:hypothetical protein